MHSTMMNTPLTITSLMKFADKVHSAAEIVSVTADNPCHSYTYGDAFKRVRKLANALQDLGAKEGDCIGTLAWNDYRHLELYYAISCSGMVCHTVNPRLFPEQLEFIINHAEDRWIFIDVAFVPVLEKVQDLVPNVEAFIVLTDEAHMPDTSLRNAICYETLIADKPDTFDWPELAETAASAMCYTSGTTGNPKGVVYDHRSTILHVYACSLPDAMSMSSREVVMPIVPMFHVNGWGLVYSGPMVGAKMVMPGPKMGDGETLCNLINTHKITSSAGVPTVWLALLQYLETSGEKVPSLQRLTVGGAACPQRIIEEFADKHNVEVQTAWGMTEMSPLGTYNRPNLHEKELPKDEYMANRLKQGRPIFGVDMRIEDEDGNELPWDGKSSGSVKVRGPWITESYYKLDSGGADENGWFETGDVACMSSDGLMQITDRTKDVIKSGGEWISSIDLENCAVNHPKVAEAAVIGVYHSKWTERPLLLAIVKEGETLTEAEMLEWFDGKVAKWWTPADCVFVDSLPHTATGKLSKKDLREEYKDFKWSDE
ncbi:long-chain fatty acid--CoA ligase [Pseudomaricurvus sp.]|uniref:long-chain fatty acid--CoA ligase n=1 Tax=Pseudomaricurvus sp. TaxID=2004510 RepID=UPI003F6C9EFC